MLRHRADLRPLFFNLLYFVLLVSVFAVKSAPMWFYIAAFPLLCMTAFQGAVQTHNAVHSPIWKARWLNKIYQAVLTLTYGHPVSAYVPGHNLSHHKYTQTRKDIMRTTKARFRFNLFNGLFFFFYTLPSIWKADGTYTKMMRTRHPKWFRQAAFEMVCLQAAQIGLFVWDWKKALVFWVVPHLYAAWGIVTMNLLQHDGCDETSEYNHSRNFVGPIVNWFTFNNGFHSIHHHMPGLHWCLLPEAHAKQIAGKIHPNLDQQSLLRYIGYTYFLNHRETYDGKPLVNLPEAGADEPWIPDPAKTAQDLGVESIDSGSDELAAYVAHRPASDLA
ncbi:MAG: fatty acid desaturase [Polyangiaceae bacterium]